MGITGLLPFVKDSCRPATLRNFSGSTVAIDAYSWLHKGAFSCAEKLVKGEKTDGYVTYCIKQLNMILDFGLKPIMVFDGCNLCSKAVTEKKRRENRDKTRQRGKEFLCQGKIKEARECFQRCVDVTPEMAREVIKACKKKGVDCIVAPYEADAQLAYLDKIGMVQLIITEDSDLILFGCNQILFKMDSCGGGLLYEKENLPKSFGAKAMKFSFEKFRYMCILSGCDYLPSLPGIGLAKACKFFTLTNNLDLLNVLSKLPSYLKMPKLVVTDEYKESFVKANNTFLYQLVFCPQKKCMVPLNSYPEDVKPDDMEYAGKYFSDDIANQIALGNINVKTMKEFDYNEDLTDFDAKSAVWSSQNSFDDETPSKVQLSAFKFNTPKPKLPVRKKRQQDENVEDLGYKPISDEELFAMYGQEPKKSIADDSFLENESTVKEEEESFEDCSTPPHESPPPTSPSPQLPFNPFKKIVKSRFFSMESQQNKDEKSTPSSITSEEKESEKGLLSTSLESASGEVEQPEEDSVNVPEVCNFHLELQIVSPKKENKENLSRLAKRKSSVSPNKQDSPSKKLKKDSVLDIVDNESDGTNVLDVLEGEVVKPISVNRFSKFRQKPKKLITTRIHDFKWSKVTNIGVKLNSSLGSDGHSCNESYESSSEAGAERQESLVSCEASPYFQTPSSQSSLNCSTSDAISDTEDADLPEINIVYTSLNETISSSSSRASSSKVLNTIDNKRKPGPCRTLGLSKTKKKNSPKVPRKETLLNFNFIRQPKSEVSTTM